MKESVVEASTHEIINDKKHEITQEGISEDIQTSVHDIFVLGIITEITYFR